MTEEGCHRVGEFRVSVDELGDGGGTQEGKNNQIQCEMRFGGTEISVSASSVETGKQIGAKLVFDACID